MIKKYGISAFAFEIIEETESTKEALLEREQYYLDTLHPFPWINNNGFNLAPTAYSPLGIKRSPKTIQKMKDSWHNNRGEEYFKQLSESLKGDKNPAKRPEVAAKISASKKGQTWKHDIERVRKHTELRKGKPFSEAAKANFRAAQQKNKTRSIEARETFYFAQRKLYEITKPDGTVFQMYSRELKIYCRENNLTYSNLIGNAGTNKPYKGGWFSKRIN